VVGIIFTKNIMDKLNTILFILGCNTIPGHRREKSGEMNYLLHVIFLVM